MQFIVNVRQTDDTTRLLLLEADSQTELEDTPGLGDAIEGLWEIPFGLKVASTKLSDANQLLLVAQIATLVDSGSNIAAGIHEIAQSTNFLTGYLSDPRIEYASRVTDYLEIFGVSEHVILQVRTGEDSGRLSEAVNMAVESIEQDIELKKATGNDLKMGIGYLLGGILSVIVLSLVLGKPAQNIIDTPQLKANAATEVIVSIHNALVGQTLFVMAALVAAFFAVRYLWNDVPTFRKIWGIKQLDEYLKARRSANFLGAWMPLFNSGISPTQSLNIISKGVSGYNRKAVETIADGVEQGQTIPSSLDGAYWSPSLILGMKAFDKAHDEARRKLLKRIKGMLITEIFVTGKRFSGLTLRIGMVAAICTIFLISAGFYAPMLMSRGG